MESSKRPRTPGSTSSSQNVQCLVDGCNADLNQCRDYHRRHKVCEFHSKSPTVAISGREQRFCQQCSRFHLLIEFDDVKRSCRKRLDGHNKRRRKPQQDLRNAGLVLNSQQGTRLMSFSTPHIYPSGVVSNSWTSTVKAENDYVMYNNNNNNKNNDQTNWNSSSNTCRAPSSAHHLQVMQQNIEPPGCSGYGGEESNSSNQKTIFTSDSALSLLSSQSAPSTMEVGFNPMVLNHHHHHHNEPMSSSQSQTAAATAQVLSSQFSGGDNRLLFGSDAENNKSLVSETDDSHGVNGNASFQFQEMFQNGPDESSGSGSHQTLTFLWE